MAKVRNEKETDFWVNGLLTAAGIKLHTDVSGIQEIDEALKTASKSGSGKIGKPDFIGVVDGFLLVIEDKKDQSFHVKKCDNGIIDLSPSAVKNYAVNGAIFYAKHLAAKTSFKKIFAFGVSGDEKHHRITPIYEEDTPTFRILDDVEGFISFNKDNIGEYYSRSVLKEVPDTQKNTEELLAHAATLHEDLRKYGNLRDNEKPLAVSGIMLALSESESENFSISSLSGDDKKTDGDKIFRAISDNLDRSAIAPPAKKDKILAQFSFLKDTPGLSLINDKLGKTPLRHFTEFIFKKIYRNIRFKSNTEDYIGQFYGEFMSYSGGDGQSLGIILTPKHICDLFCALADLKPTDKVFDPCCGTAGFLIAAMHSMLAKATTDEERKDIRKNHLFGIEQRPDMFTVATTNMILRGDGKSNLLNGDFFSFNAADIQKKYAATVGMINPPYSQGSKDSPHLYEISFIEHLLDSLAKGARCIAIVPQSTMIGKTKEEKAYKESILKRHTLEGVITLQGGTFYHVGTMPCIAVFTAYESHPKEHKVKFIDFANDGFCTIPHIGLRDDGSAMDKREHLLAVWRGEQPAPSSFCVETTVEPSDEWLHSFYYFNDEIPAESDLIKTIGDYLSFEFSMVMRDREDIFKSAFVKWPTIPYVASTSHKVLWKPFRLLDYFDFIRGDQKDMNSLVAGREILISARNAENGLKGFYKGKRSHKRYSGDCLTLNNDGDGGVGLAFYQPHEFLLDTHVYALYPKQSISMFALLFVSHSLSMCRPLFSHGRSISKGRLNVLKIMLPATSSGKPDFAYMDDCGRKCMCERMTKYLAYLKGHTAWEPIGTDLIGRVGAVE